MRVLGIETSCDETAVAIVEDRGANLRIASSVVSSQINKHRPFGGVVPEIATREHLRNLPILVPQALQQAEVTWKDLQAIAVTEGPGLASSLLIGSSYAKGLAAVLALPLFGINHLEGHLFSPFLATHETPRFPFIGLIVSGGHTFLIRVEGWDRYQRLGATVDDAAGETFDKVARLLGLAYPGGPEIEKLAREGNPLAFVFPQSFPERDNFHFSFSGLKTAVRYFYEKNQDQHRNPAWLADLCASFQEAIVSVITKKTVEAAKQTRIPNIVAAGGVLCNRYLRQRLKEACHQNGLRLALADAALCTDNAAMIASVAIEKIKSGIEPKPNPDIDPNLGLLSTQPTGDVSLQLRRAAKLKKR